MDIEHVRLSVTKQGLTVGSKMDFFGMQLLLSSLSRSIVVNFVSAVTVVCCCQCTI
jgi:hypothetical protein